MITALDVKADALLDMTGVTCPGPLLGAKKLVDDLSPGQVLLLISDCPGTHDDLFSWARYTGYRIARTEKRANGAIGFYIQKGKSPHVRPNAVLDIRGVACPGPIVEAKKLLNGMQRGEVLRLISNCPGVVTDVPAWAHATGMELVATHETAPGEHEFYIRKR
ncbi:MAG TPA: sulfurtransferase TusA family protein [Casimicrobiaceae bacterium]|nr:sulfurtransferase TusA family protein [Casimicrobiaceae bacterium]